MNWPEGVEKPQAVEEYEALTANRDMMSVGAATASDKADTALTACGHRIAELEREVERMKVCGTCEHFRPGALTMRNWCECCDEQPVDEPLMHDPCIWSPSRWDISEGIAP